MATRKRTAAKPATTPGSGPAAKSGRSIAELNDSIKERLAASDAAIKVGLTEKP